MKLIKLIILVSLIWNNSGLLAQQPSFDLSDYKLRDIRFNALSTFLSLSQGNDESKYLEGNSGDIKSGGLSNNLRLEYSGISSTEKWFRITNATLRNSLRWTDQEYISQNYLLNSFEISTSARVNAQNSRYYDEDFFVAFDFDIDASIQRSKSYENSSGTETEFKSKYYEFLGMLPIKIGQGRLEQVTDARQAIYILDALKERGRIANEPDSAAIHEFAKHISHVRNQRYFDFRLQRISEMEQLDSFLLGGNYITEQDITYFTILNDMWGFGNLPIRYSGKTIALALYNGFFYDQDDNGFGFSNGINKEFLFQGGIENTIEKPINLFWQNTFEMYFYLGVIKGNYQDMTNAIDFDTNIPKFNVGIMETVGYYPNTRTDIDFSIGAHFVQFLDRTDEDREVYGLKGHGVNVRSSVNMRYFISPQLSLSGQMRMAYSIYNPGDDVSEINLGILEIDRLIYYPGCSAPFCNQLTNFRKRLSNSFNINLRYSFF